MKIIKDSADIIYKSWNELEDAINSKLVHNPDISTKELLEDVKKIKEVSHKSFFSKPQFPYISNLFNQIQYFDPSKKFSFIEELHLIGRLISRLQTTTHNQKLFNKGIFTNFGFYTQFLVSAWLNKYLSVKDFELNNHPFHTDALVEVLGKEVHFHIKDISENEREERLSDLCIYIDSYFTNKARNTKNDQHLAVVRVVGVPPGNLPNNYWLDFASKLEVKAQKLEVKFSPALGYGNSEELTTTITLGWRPFNGIFVSPMNNFNNSYRLSFEYEVMNNKLLSKTPQNQIHILIVVTGDKYSTRSLRKLVEGQKLGIVVLEIFDFEFERSTILLPEDKKIEAYLNAKIPKFEESCY